MNIPATFPAHWRAAIDRGDLSGFTAREDLIKFFIATSNHGCFQDLSTEQRENVAEARGEPTGAHSEAMMRLHGKRSQEERQQAELLAADFKAGKQHPKAAASWNRAIERVNAGVRLSQVATNPSGGTR